MLSLSAEAVAAVDLEQYQAERIDAFSAKAQKVTLPMELEVLVREMTSDTGFVSFPLLLSLLSQPVFTEKFADSRFTSSLDLLRLFAYGTWQDYKSNLRSFCAMSSAQEWKLKQLTFLTLARSNKKLPYIRLKSLLGFSDDVALEGFLDSCCSSGIVRGNLNKDLRCFEVLYTFDTLQKSRGKVAGKSFAVFLEEEKNASGKEAGLLYNGIVKQVSVPQDGSNCCMSELQSRTNSLFLSLMGHLIDAHAMGKSFGGQIYAGMFDVIGEQLLLRPEAAAQKQLTPKNFMMDRKAVASVFRNNTGLNILHQGRDGICKQILYPLYMENLLDHLEGNISNLLEAHRDNPISMARDKNYITFILCHPTFLKHPVLSVLFWYVRMYYTSSDKFEKQEFVSAMSNIKMPTWHKDVQKHWLLKKVFSEGVYTDTSKDCFKFVRDLKIHVPKYLEERQKFMYRAAIINLLVVRHFGDFLPETLYHMLCTYSEKDPKFDLKDWIERLQQLPEEDTTVWTMEWDQLITHGFPNNDLLTHPVNKTVLELEKLRENVIDGASASCSLKKWRLLNILRGESRIMYYKVLIDNFEEYAPVVYAPTIRIVCQNSSGIFRSPWGVYLSPEDQGHMMSIFHNLLANEVHLIVVTDGSSVFGFDDLGAKGMGIAIGKTDLYIAAAGINPHKVLPVMIDVGTDSEKLLEDPLYHGIHEHRLDEHNLCVIIGEFMSAVYTRWPKVIVQFEGFQSKWAFKLLEQYKTMHCVFNDDIQATIGVLIAGLLRAVKAQGKPISDFPQQRIVVTVTGVDSAGVAILNAVSSTMARVSQDNEGSSVFENASSTMARVSQDNEGSSVFENARNQIWIVDEYGLFTDDRANADTAKLPFARKKSELPQGLYEGAVISNVMNIVKPDIILLLSAVPGLSSQEVLQSIKNSSSSRPAIFAMSNCPCTAEEVFTSLGENVMFASSNQFSNVNLGDGNIGYSNHVNNIYLFPGIALGTILSGARLISDDMLYAAAKCLASLVRDEDAVKGILYPSISSIRDITKRVAVVVVRAAVRTFLSEGYGTMDASRLANLSEEETMAYIEEYMWSPT